MNNNANDSKLKKKKVSKIIIAVVVVLVAIIAFALVYTFVLKPQKEYNKALGYYSIEDYEDAERTFKGIIDYKDSKKYIDECESKLLEQKYQKAVSLMKEGSYKEALVLFEEIDDYLDSKEYLDECKNYIASAEGNVNSNVNKDAVYSAYYKIIKSKVYDEGGPTVVKDIGFEHSSGYKVADLCFVKLIDFNNDGVEELVVAEFDRDDWVDEFEVYAYYDGTVHKVLDDQKFEIRSQDLGYVSIEFYKKDGKYFIYHWNNTGFLDDGYTLSFDGRKFTKDLVWCSREDGYYYDGKQIEEKDYMKTVPNFDIKIAYGENYSILDKYYYSTDDMEVYALSFLTKPAAEQLATDTKEVINTLKAGADRFANSK